MVDFARASFRDEDAKLPPVVGYLWRWFNDLSDWRDSAFGVGAISHQEIESWARLFRIDISPSEVDVLRRIDRAFRIYQNERDKPPHEENIGKQLREVVKKV